MFVVTASNHQPLEFNKDTVPPRLTC